MAGLDFDLQKALAAPGLAEEAGPPTLVDAGLLYTAALWDVYVRALRATRTYPFFFEAVQALDGLLRLALVVLSASLVAELWIARSHPPVELDTFSLVYLAVSAGNVLLVLRERLAGRFGGPAPLAAGQHFVYQIAGRSRFSGDWVALLVTLLYCAVAAAMLLVSLTFASALTKSADATATRFLALSLFCEVVYVFARLPTFAQIAAQGGSALRAAGLHTLLVLNVELPLGLVFVVLSAAF